MVDPAHDLPKGAASACCRNVSRRTRVVSCLRGGPPSPRNVFHCSLGVCPGRSRGVELVEGAGRTVRSTCRKSTNTQRPGPELEVVMLLARFPGRSLSTRIGLPGDRSRVSFLQRSFAVILLGGLIALTPLAYASPPDSVWIEGVYDGADFDDVIWLVTETQTAPQSPVHEAAGPFAVIVRFVALSPEAVPPVVPAPLVRPRSPPAS